jgi:Holliday junction DNA helicase RuvA
MIGSLRGTLLDLKPDRCLVEVGGVGYLCLISLQTYSALNRAQGEVRLHIHTHVREDILSLIGFAAAEERELFHKLTGISGIGPRVALQVLSRYPVAELKAAIGAGDLPKLTAIPGVGKKTAERILLELKGSLQDLVASAAASPAQDAVSALVNLGYSVKTAQAAVDAAARDHAQAPLEELIVAALRRMA